MNDLQLLNEIKSLSEKDITKMLSQIKKRPKKKVTLRRKASTYNINIKNRLYIEDVKKKDVLKHFLQDLLPEIGVMSSAAIKTQIVSLFEMLADTESETVDKNTWRQKAAKIIMFDTKSHLTSYITSVATGIRCS